MSRIGRLPIAIPADVTVEYKDSVVTVKGPKATLTREIASKNIGVEISANEVVVTRANDNKESRSMHGLYRMLIANMVKGVVTPFTRTLVVNGVGYKVAVAGNKLTMNLGLSHTVECIAPEGITITCPDAIQRKTEEIQVQSLGQGDPLEEGMAIHSNILACRTPLDRGAWQATIHRVAKSQKQLSD